MLYPFSPPLAFASQEICSSPNPSLLCPFIVQIIHAKLNYTLIIPTHSQNYISLQSTLVSILCIVSWNDTCMEGEGSVLLSRQGEWQKPKKLPIKSYALIDLFYLPLLYLKLSNVHAPLTFTSFVEGRIKFISKLEISNTMNLKYHTSLSKVHF